MRATPRVAGWLGSAGARLAGTGVLSQAGWAAPSPADHSRIAADFDRAAGADRPVLLGEFGVAGEVSP